MPAKINISMIVKILNNDKESISEALDLLINNAEEENLNMVKYYKENNWELVGISAHNLKSKMKFIGCTDAAGILSELESASKNPDKIWNIGNLLNNFEKEYYFISKELLEIKQIYIY
jgi:hypothetical protein